MQIERDLRLWTKEKLVRRTLGNIEDRVKLDWHVYGNVFAGQRLVLIAREVRKEFVILLVGNLIARTRPQSRRIIGLFACDLNRVRYKVGVLANDSL